MRTPSSSSSRARNRCAAAPSGRSGRSASVKPASVVAVAACLAALSGGGCGGGNGSDGGVTPAFAPTFTNVNTNLILPVTGYGCTVSNCHTTGAGLSVGGLDLADSPYLALVGDGGGVPAVNPWTNDVSFQFMLDAGLVAASYQVMLDGGLVMEDGGLVELDGGLVTRPDGGQELDGGLITLDGGPNGAYPYDYNGMLLVKPGDPENSLLFQKISASGADPGCTQTPTGPCQYGQHMPNVSGETLPASYVEAVREWIANGALNN